MDDLIAAALGQMLETVSGIRAVYVDPPESFGDTPAAVILESSGEAGRDAYRGGWSSSATVRCVLYVTPRTHLPEAVRAARPWVQPLLALWATNDTPLYQPPTPAPTLADPDPDAPAPVETGELQTLAWSVGVAQYAKAMYAIVEIVATYRTDWTVTVGCPVI
jgi:hypothetical protein